MIQGHAKLHYGVLACYGCKVGLKFGTSFGRMFSHNLGLLSANFNRFYNSFSMGKKFDAASGKYRYVCRFGNNCIVDKFQRNSCRCCRFQRCLEVGMDPKAVRPDRSSEANMTNNYIIDSGI